VPPQAINRINLLVLRRRIMKPAIVGLLSTALFVALSFTPALAQGPDKDVPPASPQAGGQPKAGGPTSQAQEPGPGDQGSAPGKVEKGKTAEKPNEGTPKAAEEPPKPEGKPAEKSTEQKPEGKPAAEQKPEGKPTEKSTEQTEKPTDKTGKSEEAEKPASETKTKDSAEQPGQPKPGTAESTEGKTGVTETDHKGAGGASAKVEPQQVEKVRTYFTAHKPDVKRIDRSAVSVSIGVALPAAIALYPLPPDVIVVTGACPLEYFVWGEDIVLVDSCSREVVEIIAGAA
jgi:outer membrane biosynthesis protein TonB